MMEVEYNEDLDEHFVTIPSTILNNLGWEEGDYLEYDYSMGEGSLKLIKV